MQVLIIILVFTLFLDDMWSDWESIRPDWDLPTRLAVMLFAYGALLLLTAWRQWRYQKRVERKGDWKAVIASERMTNWALAGIVLTQLASVGVLDWGNMVRDLTGNLIIIDELILLAPAVLSMLAVWALQYPVVRMVRDAEVMRRLDEGQPMYPIWTRSQFIIAQVRMSFVLLLLPIVCVLTWRESVEWLARQDWTWIQFLRGEFANAGATIVGTAIVFAFAPIMICSLWDTHPLPDGETRTRLMTMCVQHRIRIRELLVWNTFGGMMNGAVMGLTGRLRYILLTDALLDSLTPTQVESVMAHELAHVRRWHLPWLLISLLVFMTGMGMLVEMGLVYAFVPPEPVMTYPATVHELGQSILEQMEWIQVQPVRPTWIDPIGISITLICTFVGFGFVSRRFEWQADAFAAQHLSGMTRANRGRNVVIQAEAVEAMRSTLGIVAKLNHVPIGRRSWRHGSIKRRQQNLQSLIGRPSRKLPIDRSVRFLKISIIIAILAIAGFITAVELGWIT